MRELVFAACATVCLAVAVPAMAEPTGYTLWCKGGEKMHADFDASDLSVRSIAVRIEFQWMPTAATPATPPPPGECSWLDRAFRPGEPNQLHYSALGNSISFTMSGGGTPHIEFGRVSRVDPTLEAIWIGLSQKKDFRLLVYNSGFGFMRVTGVAP